MSLEPRSRVHPSCVKFINSTMSFYLEQKQVSSSFIEETSKFCITEKENPPNQEQHTHSQNLHLQSMWLFNTGKNTLTKCIITRYWFLGPCKAVLKKK